MPVVTLAGAKYALETDRPKSAGKIREYWGNVPQVVKAYAWARAMGPRGSTWRPTSRVVANNYMDKKLGQIPGLQISHPHIGVRRMEMTRWSLGPLAAETGVGTVDFATGWPITGSTPGG